MTDRVAPLLDRLAVLLLIGVVVAPLLWAAVQIIPPRPNVQWMATPQFSGPRMGVALELQFDPPWGFSVIFLNKGNAESENVRIRLSLAPSNVDIQSRGGHAEYELIPTDEGVIVDLGSLEAQEAVEVTLYRVTLFDIEEVLHGGEPVDLGYDYRLPLFETGVRVPRWSLVAGLFLLAGLGVQNLAMRRRAVTRRAT